MAEATEQPAAGGCGKVRIAGIALKWLRCDKEANFNRAEKLIREAAANGAQVVVTSECFLDGYVAEENTLPLAMFHELAEPVPDGAYSRRLAALATELRIVLVAGMVERAGKQCFNAAVLFGPDGEHLGTYHKENLAPDDELRHTPGSGPSVFDTPHGRIGVRICFDRSKPEAVKATCDAGADYVLLLCGGVYGEDNTRMVRDRARENQRHMIFAHPVHFVAVNPDGSILAEAQFGGTGAWPTEDRYKFPLIGVHGAMRGMVIATEQVDTEIDCNGVGYCEVRGTT